MSGDTATYATVEDLACVVTDVERAARLITRASVEIRSYLGGDPQDADVAREVCCMMVERALLANTTAYGASQSSITVGDHTQSWSWSDPNGEVYLKQKEKRMLRGRRRMASFMEPKVWTGEDDDDA